MAVSSGEALSTYTSESGNVHHVCSRCGTKVLAKGGMGETEMAVIYLNALDNLKPETWAKAPVRYFDDANDNWETPPAFIAHL